MMKLKLLYISHTKIFGNDGGSKENFKYYHGLKRYAEKTGSQLRVLSLDQNFCSAGFPQMTKSLASDVYSRLRGHSTFLYSYWKKCRDNVISFDPDVVVLGRTRMGFIAKDIKQQIHNTKIVVNVENIEVDYVDAYFAHESSLLGSIKKYYEKATVKRDEQLAFRYADRINYLTQRDYLRAQKLYSPQADHSIIPICISRNSQNDINKNRVGEKRKIIFLGSLGYESNIEGIQWFIDNVWLIHFAANKNVQLVIGGSGASSAFASYLRSVSNCVYVGAYDDINDIVDDDSIMIAPILHGAGMKVKVAESMRLGSPIVASQEALVGYEECTEIQLPGIVNANGPLEFRDAINDLLSLSPTEFKSMREGILQCFSRLYSLERSDKQIESVIKRLV